MSLNVNVSGTYHNAQPKVNVSGTWHDAIWWQNVSGTWKEISLGAFTINDPSKADSGSGSTGPGHTEETTHDTTSAAIVISGGPTSGSYSYSWSNIRLDASGGSSVPGSTTSSTLTAHFDFNVGAQQTGTRTVLADLTVTDTVSGLSATHNNVALSWSYTNNTG